MKEMEWFQSLVLFTQKELKLWKEMRCSNSVPRCGGGARDAGHAIADISVSDTDAHAVLLFMNRLEEAMDVSFQKTLLEVVGVIALYALKKHISVYSNHCVCLVGFVLVHNKSTLQQIVHGRRLPMRTQDMSMGFISHKDILKVQKVGMCPHLQSHICVTTMHGHVLDQTVSHGVYLSERAFGIHLRKWAMQAKSALHLWMMLRYTLAGFGGTDVPLLPSTCLEQLALCGISPDGDGSSAHTETACLNNFTQCLLAVECTPSSVEYFQEFVNYIQHDYVPSMKKLEEVERVLSEQDREWERFPVIYTDRSRQVWGLLSSLSSFSLPSMETFLQTKFMPKHCELFSRTPYEMALEHASVAVQRVQGFGLYEWGLGNAGGQVNVHWKPVSDRTSYCRRELESSVRPSPLLCKNPELSTFAKLRQPLLMDSSESMRHVYPFTRYSMALRTVPSTASIVTLLVGKDDISTIMNGKGMLRHLESCIHEVTNPLLNISTIVVDVDVQAGSQAVSKLRDSQANVTQFCSELVQNTRRVLLHLETKCTSLTGLANDVKHIVFRTDPDNRTKEGFHHLIVLPEWVCLQSIQVASGFVELLKITRHCMPMVGEQGVQFDNIYESNRHAMRLPFQCKSKGNNPLLLVHSDYGDTWDLLDIGGLFIHGPKRHPVGRLSRGYFLIDDISGINVMSESTEHYKQAVSVLSHRNRIEAQQSSALSVLERFGKGLNCTSINEICTLLQKAFTRYISKRFVDKVNKTAVEKRLSMTAIGLKWLEDKQLMTVTNGCSPYWDVCIAQRHQNLQHCIYYLCIRRQQHVIRAVLYEMCFSTNCVACKMNPPYDTGIYGILE